MAEYRDHLAEIEAAGARVAGIAVDAPDRAEVMRQALHLPFPILCDTGREVVTPWGLLNRREHGGIAYPAVFVIGTDRRVRYRSVDDTTSRVRVDGVLEFLRSGRELAGTEALPKRRAILPLPVDIARALWNIVRYGMRTPYR